MGRILGRVRAPEAHKLVPGGRLVKTATTGLRRDGHIGRDRIGHPIAVTRRDVSELGADGSLQLRIALGGELPLNTFGGQIGAGRLHGFGFAHEAVVQLRGKGGERQIKDDPRVAVATSGGGPLATALLLARD